MDQAKRICGKADSSISEVDRHRHQAVATCGCGIAVMAKASTPGRAKTRLVPPLTYDEAAALNTAFLRDVIENILAAAERTSPGTGIAAYAAYGPPGSEDFFRDGFPPSLGLIPAWLPNFGDCLFHTIEEVFARGHAAAVVLNADSPTLPTALLNETVEILARPGDRAVLGPSSDGGYYLLGLKAAHRHLFEDIAWSTERVARQTRERAREVGLDLHLLPEWYDVDDLTTLQRLYAELCGSALQGRQADVTECPPHRARHTTALCHRLWPTGDFERRSEARMQPVRAAV